MFTFPLGDLTCEGLGLEAGDDFLAGDFLAGDFFGDLAGDLADLAGDLAGDSAGDLAGTSDFTRSLAVTGVAILAAATFTAGFAAFAGVFFPF